jgi:hypothetical protein
MGAVAGQSRPRLPVEVPCHQHRHVDLIVRQAFTVEREVLIVVSTRLTMSSTRASLYAVTSIASSDERVEFLAIEGQEVSGHDDLGLPTIPEGDAPRSEWLVHTHGEPSRITP